MTNNDSRREAYLLGCLFGRGSIKRTLTGNFRLLFRFPYRHYSRWGIGEFISEHFMEIASPVDPDPGYSEVVDGFNVTYCTIECKISPEMFKRLTTYGISDDVYRQARIPNIILDYPRPLLHEFVRGVADTVATFDEWHRRHRVQFSFIGDNWHLPVDFCRLLQTALNIPVFYIEWGGEYMERGGRDHLVKAWVVNFCESNFPQPLFYNSTKQDEFQEYLEIDLNELGRRRRPSLQPCPVGRRSLGYARTCIRCGCRQLPSSITRRLNT